MSLIILKDKQKDPLQELSKAKNPVRPSEQTASNPISSAAGKHAATDSKQADIQSAIQQADNAIIQPGNIYCCDCMQGMKLMKPQSVCMTLTDIPYDAVNRPARLRSLDKQNADIATFSLDEFLQETERITSHCVCIFCGKEQFSQIFAFFSAKKGTTRCIVWEKTNPSPMNGDWIYLSGVELAVWWKRTCTGPFNAHCKNSVFHYPSGRRKYHPTEKNIKLFEELIEDNTDEGDIIFDPCIGSGTTALAAIKHNRQYIGMEIDESYTRIAEQRIETESNGNFQQLQMKLK